MSEIYSATPGTDSDIGEGIISSLLLHVPDPLTSARWYSLLGGALDTADPYVPRVHLGRSDLSFWRTAPDEPPTRVGIGLLVDDLTAVRAALLAAGVEVSSVTREVIAAIDPNGNLVTVMSES